MTGIWTLSESGWSSRADSYSQWKISPKSADKQQIEQISEAHDRQPPSWAFFLEIAEITPDLVLVVVVIVMMFDVGAIMVRLIELSAAFASLSAVLAMLRDGIAQVFFCLVNASYAAIVVVVSARGQRRTH